MARKPYSCTALLNNDPIAEWKKQIHCDFPKSANAALQTVVLDMTKKEDVLFRDSAEKIWGLISVAGVFECSDLKTVKTELEQAKELIRGLREQLTRAGKRPLPQKGFFVVLPSASTASSMCDIGYLKLICKDLKSFLGDLV